MCVGEYANWKLASQLKKMASLGLISETGASTLARAPVLVFVIVIMQSSLSKGGEVFFWKILNTKQCQGNGFPGWEAWRDSAGARADCFS